MAVARGGRRSRRGRRGGRSWSLRNSDRTQEAAQPPRPVGSEPDGELRGTDGLDSTGAAVALVVDGQVVEVAVGVVFQTEGIAADADVLALLTLHREAEAHAVGVRVWVVG